MTLVLLVKDLKEYITNMCLSNQFGGNVQGFAERMELKKTYLLHIHMYYKDLRSNIGNKHGFYLLQLHWYDMSISLFNVK